MTLYILVPVKQLAEAKSRLAAVLPESERQTVTLRMLHSVLQVVQTAQQRIDAVGMVVSPDPIILNLAASYGLTPLADAPLSAGMTEAASPDALLNAALEQATAYAQSLGASAVLILPADLPLLTLADVTRLWRTSQQLYSARAMVIAPDNHEQGTNALLVRPPGVLRYEFGPGSLARHCRQARDLGMAWHVDRSPRLGLDVDLPADLAHWLALERADSQLLPENDGMHEAPPPMLLDAEILAFLAEPGLLMRLGTLGSDGFPQVTPMWYDFEDGHFLVTTASDRIKARNMLAHPQVGFAIDSDQRPYRGVAVRGLARLLAEGEAARPLTRRIVARYVPAERLDAMVDTLMQAPRLVFALDVVRITKMGLTSGVT
ncbi:MAG: 2-phospho-L-lactate guanylyltransferase [Anaerolineae bacterium]